MRRIRQIGRIGLIRLIGLIGPINAVRGADPSRPAEYSEDVKAEASEWQTEMKRRKPYLDAVMRIAPASPEAAAAKHALAELSPL